MRLEIKERLKPFSHTPGIGCLVPGTHEKVTAYPARIVVGRCVLELFITGPVEDFTLEQDLEKNCVWVWGRAKEGFYRLKIEAKEGGIGLFVERAPLAGLKTSRRILQKKERLTLVETPEFFLPARLERLSFGESKSQEWDLVWRRFELSEILPVLFALGQKTPPVPTSQIREDLGTFCLAAFSQLLVPRLVDDQHQGLDVSFSLQSHPSLPLIEAARSIRHLFFRNEGRHLTLLPTSYFEAGRFLLAQASGVGEIDFEWRKGLLHRLILRAHETCDVELELQKKIKSYRLRMNLSEKGVRKNADESLSVVSGKTYYLDRFQV